MRIRCHRRKTRADVAILLAIVAVASIASGCMSTTAKYSATQAPLSGDALQRRIEAQAAARAARTSALRAFTGKRHGAYIQGQVLLSDQIMVAMGIPDNADGSASRSKPVLDGYTLRYGCRQHSCDEKGAVLYDSSGRVVRAGLISFKCSRHECEDKPTLTIFKKGSMRADPKLDDVLDGVIKHWAEARVPEIKAEIQTLR